MQSAGAIANKTTVGGDTFHGRPCPQGHTLRYGSTKRCVHCARDRAARWHADNPERELERRRDYRAKNPEEWNRQRRAWDKANPEKRKAQRERAIAKNPGHYYGKHLAYNGARRARVRKAMPAWVDRREVDAFFVMAARVSACTGIPHHVDHVHPLGGENLSGLHVPWNLRVIPAVINVSKHNKVEA